MSASSEQQYLLHWKGAQSGPFSLATIREKLDAGEISRMHQVNLNGRWVFLDEFLEKQSREEAARQRAAEEERDQQQRRNFEEQLANERAQRTSLEARLAEAGNRAQLTVSDRSGPPAPAPAKITVQRDGRDLGPYTLEQVNEMLAGGQAALTDFAWVEGTPDWVRIESIPGIVTLVSPSKADAKRGIKRSASSRRGGSLVRKSAFVLALLLCLGGLGCLGYYAYAPQGPGKLRWDPPVVRKSLMTFAYKVYGNPGALNGRYFLSKIVFHNDGEGAVHNFSISYQIPDYIPWTTEEMHTEIPPGQKVVKLFYPQLPAKVTQLSAETTVTLETRIRWKDKSDQPREEILRSNIELRGVNEVEYTELPQNEIVTWNDMFTASPFLAAMVTPNDPVVKELAAAVSDLTGGTTAGAGGKREETVKIMEALYNYMCDTRMHYTSALGVPEKMGDVRTLVQTVRMPRDVIITNQGLCVELALLWSSVMEHYGLRTKIIIVPGHAFTVVFPGDGSRFIPIECTAITPNAVGEKGAVSFVKAVEMAETELDRAGNDNVILDVRASQHAGFHAPELPVVEIDKIKSMLATRRPSSAHK